MRSGLVGNCPDWGAVDVLLLHVCTLLPPPLRSLLIRSQNAALSHILPTKHTARHRRRRGNELEYSNLERSRPRPLPIPRILRLHIHWLRRLRVRCQKPYTGLGELSGPYRHTACGGSIHSPDLNNMAKSRGWKFECTNDVHPNARQLCVRC